MAAAHSRYLGIQQTRNESIREIYHSSQCLALFNKSLKYRITITDTTGTIKKGFLARINDTLLYLSPVSVALNDPKQDVSRLWPIDYKHIITVVIRRKGSFGRGVLTGAVIGTVLGAFIGLSGIEDKQNTLDMLFERTSVGGSIGLGAGAFIGGVYGAVNKQEFSINGNGLKFKMMQMTIMNIKQQ